MTTGLEPVGNPVPEAPLLQLGDMTVSRSWVTTPYGSFRLHGARVTATDYVRVETRTPTWAVVVAIVGFFLIFLFSLLFLLAKETALVGFVQVTLSNGTATHTVQLPVSSGAQQWDIHQRIAFLQRLVAEAP